MPQPTAKAPQAVAITKINPVIQLVTFVLITFSPFDNRNRCARWRDCCARVKTGNTAVGHAVVVLNRTWTGRFLARLTGMNRDH